MEKLKHGCGWAPVAHACNPSYPGGRDQEDRGLKPVWANNLRDSILKKPITKIRLLEWLKVKALSSNPSTENKAKQKSHGCGKHYRLISKVQSTQYDFMFSFSPRRLGKDI
jgi:hypothetical protein